ncbi:MAG: cytochrome c [Gammaproteobacteria bacterium]|nr:cytochrome c [Gammaproteobacteria bacterium]MCP5136941.1 cytochrome c [Gammaproteobacteria bacterium]
MNAMSPWWASAGFWRKTAVLVTALSFIVLIVLTLDSMAQMTAGGERVPAYSVINKRITYVEDAAKGHKVPAIGDDAPLFGKAVSEEDAEALVSLGKKTVQAKNCMNCHTLLGNGAYFAPDLTKAWLDPSWGNEAARESLMLAFLLDPPGNARTFGSGRKMPNLGITDEEAHGVIAFLKWMSSIDTNGFPNNFMPMQQGE